MIEDRWSKHATAGRAALIYRVSPRLAGFMAYINAAWGGDQRCHDTREQIAEALGITVRTVQRHITQAMEAGLLERQGRTLVPGSVLLKGDTSCPSTVTPTVPETPVVPGTATVPLERDTSCPPKGTATVTHLRREHVRPSSNNEHVAKGTICVEEGCDNPRQLDAKGKLYPRCAGHGTGDWTGLGSAPARKEHPSNCVCGELLACRRRAWMEKECG